MADVDIRRDSFSTETTTTKKTRKVKKTKRRESADQGTEVTITEIEQTTENAGDPEEEGYVNELQRNRNEKNPCLLIVVRCLLIQHHNAPNRTTRTCIQPFRWAHLCHLPRPIALGQLIKLPVSLIFNELSALMMIHWLTRDDEHAIKKSPEWRNSVQWKLAYWPHLVQCAVKMQITERMRKCAVFVVCWQYDCPVHFTYPLLIVKGT